jgi:hypothetical protein
VLGLIFCTYWLPIYTALPLSVALAFLLQIAVKHLARDVATSPFFASVIIASLVWVTYCWATRLLGTLASAIYPIAAGVCVWSFYKSIRTDPGFVDADGDAKMVRAYPSLLTLRSLNSSSTLAVSTAQTFASSAWYVWFDMANAD